MSDALLPYYNKELAYFRRLGAEFAQSHPKIAARLRLGAEGSEDPHVSRLIESFAYIAARIRHKIDDDFPEVAEALLNALYPHYLRPTPSMAIVQFALAPGQGSLGGAHVIDRGSLLDTEPIEGEPCRFRTCYETTLWPLSIEMAEYRAAPFKAPRTSFSSRAAAVLRVELTPTLPAAPLESFGGDRLRFFIKAAPEHSFELYELLFNHTRQVAVSASASDEARLLPEGAVQPIGFELHESILPASAQSFPGFRLLSEYFTFAEKFLFFDVTGLSPRTLSGLKDSLQLTFYLDRYSAALEENLDAETLQLGCTPIVNLYRQRAEPIPLSQAEHRYRVVPDARRPLAHEVYSIDEVVAVSSEGEETSCTPFYSFKHGASAKDRIYWCADRQAAGRQDDKVDEGTEVFLSLVDLDFQPNAPADWVVEVETTCLNRDLPHRLPFGGGQPRLFLEGGGPIEPPLCLTPPSRTLRPPLRHGLLWRLVSHLAFGRLGLLGADEPLRAEGDLEGGGSVAAGAEALREILRLYDLNDSPETQAIIEGVADLTTRRVVGRVAGGACRGVEAALTLDEDRFTGAGMYLFACVLERFFALSSSMNSFTQTVLKTKQREGVVRKWPPRDGQQTLL